MRRFGGLRRSLGPVALVLLGVAARHPAAAADAETPPAPPTTVVPAPRPAGPSPEEIEAMAHQRTLSIGGYLGEPLVGVTVKMLTSHELTDAWEIGLGWSKAGDDGLQFHAQRQWHIRTLHASPSQVATFYLGAGGRVKEAESTRFGVRGAVGFNWVFPRAPRRHEAFFEVAPIVDLTPDVHTFVNVEAGFRFFLPVGAR
jgi:hypothetical protein